MPLHLVFLFTGITVVYFLTCCYGHLHQPHFLTYRRDRMKIFLLFCRRSDPWMPLPSGIFFGSADPMTCSAVMLCCCFTMFVSSCIFSIFACMSSIANLRSSGFLLSLGETEGGWSFNPSCTIWYTCFLPAVVKMVEEKNKFKKYGERETVADASIVYQSGKYGSS